MKFDTVCNRRKVTKLISAIVLQNTGEDWGGGVAVSP